MLKTPFDVFPFQKSLRILFKLKAQANNHIKFMVARNTGLNIDTDSGNSPYANPDGTHVVCQIQQKSRTWSGSQNFGPLSSQVYFAVLSKTHKFGMFQNSECYCEGQSWLWEILIQKADHLFGNYFVLLC